MQVKYIRFLELFNSNVQYKVPLWQRRYCWGQEDIYRLMQDILAIADVSEQDPTHYAGNMLTFAEPGPAGVVPSVRLVDGQQRLTTVSMLLACIASKLDKEGPVGGWTGELIREQRLRNALVEKDKQLKLLPQSGDREEYETGLSGKIEGSGAVSQAWRTLSREVAKYPASTLLTGLDRLSVVSIGLDSHEDPQQIFESLNGTGKPLTESEKVKNWLLIGLPETTQRELHDDHWKKIEESLGAERSSEPIDTFLRDFMRWKTGELVAISKTYEQLRRWALKESYSSESGRQTLCRELSNLAVQYGKLTGTGGRHENAEVAKELAHLRNMGLNPHRPFTLRLLHQNSSGTNRLLDSDLLQIIKGVSAWITRLWLADFSQNGLNRAMVELASDKGPSATESTSEYWLNKIKSRRNQRIGVPTDEQVREGVRKRSAYGGANSAIAWSVLWELIDFESPKKEILVHRNSQVEHIMPVTLTQEWLSDLGEDAQTIHRLYLHRLGNLTITHSNPELGNKPFRQKRKTYEASLIPMTSRIAQYENWNIDAMETRAEELAQLTLSRWQWQDDIEGEIELQPTSLLRWRLNDLDWRLESSAASMVLNVTAALLDLNKENGDRLSGGALSTSLQPAHLYKPGTKHKSISFHQIPGHKDWVMNPYKSNYTIAVRFCEELGKKCNTMVYAENLSTNAKQRFWRLLKDETGGVPGQKDSWRGPNQYTSPCNSYADQIGISLAKKGAVLLYVYANKAGGVFKERMVNISHRMEDTLTDQNLEGNVYSQAEYGRSVWLEHEWSEEEEQQWPEVAEWIHDQWRRLKELADDRGNLG